MVGLRRILTVAAIGSALVAHPALSQQGSVSLTHTVTVTVPPRIKVRVDNLGSPTEMAPSRQAARADGLAVSVSATQSWALSIGSAQGSSKLQWSTERNTGFSAIGSEALVASGRISPAPAVATVFFRDGGQPRDDGGEVVTLTVVAP